MDSYSHANNSQRQLLTPDELAAELRLAPSTVAAWISRHPERLPPPVRLGKRYRWVREVVDRWVREHSQPNHTNGRRRGRPPECQPCTRQ